MSVGNKTSVCYQSFSFLAQFLSVQTQLPKPDTKVQYLLPTYLQQKTFHRYTNIYVALEEVRNEISSYCLRVALAPAESILRICFLFASDQAKRHIFIHNNWELLIHVLIIRTYLRILHIFWTTVLHQKLVIKWAEEREETVTNPLIIAGS